ncbi:hypothetical protein [Thiorhodococcus minor]|uniref:Uncharacterized protein n=1 Tax=Thiorhodococcus minor TaxID=57489 RepID=A0A6M0K6D3_9GAMM|nr:hypothetical protein [Thiorhodococcus minor]NEV65290.1 hypothetical protein [Thiorhodococcus minor]
MKASRFYQALLLASVSLQSFAAAAGIYEFSCGTPADAYGRAIPTPTGNIGFTAVPGGMCGGDAEFTWDYAGTLLDGNDRCSFMANIVQSGRLAEECVDGICGSYSFGFHGLHFAFKRAGSTYFLNSLYGGDSAEAISAVLRNSVDWMFSTSSLDGLEIDASLIASDDGSHRWIVQSNGASPVAPLYLGLPGQPGHKLRMQGEGAAFLWRIDPDGTKQLAKYHYALDIDFVDERGVVAQGYGGGYVGPALVADGEAIPVEEINAKTRISEYEIAQPRLKVLSWQITISADGEPADGFEAIYSLQGNEGMLWNDLGPVKESKSTPAASTTAIDSSASKALSGSSARGVSRLAIPMVTKTATDTKSLYHGNWIPIQFSQGPYEGASMVFNVYWDKYVPRPSDQTTDSYSWSKAGWGSLYTGILPDNVTSAYSLTELMVPGLPVIAEEDPRESGWVNPFEVRFIDFVEEKYRPAYPWVTKIEITVRAHSRLRTALASYANLKSGRWDQPTDFADTDLILSVISLYPDIENTMFASEVAQYYESAAVVLIDNIEVGYAWIEHMGQPN